MTKSVHKAVSVFERERKYSTPAKKFWNPSFLIFFIILGGLIIYNSELSLNTGNINILCIAVVAIIVLVYSETRKYPLSYTVINSNARSLAKQYSESVLFTEFQFQFETGERLLTNQKIPSSLVLDNIRRDKLSKIDLNFLFSGSNSDYLFKVGSFFLDVMVATAIKPQPKYLKSVGIVEIRKVNNIINPVILISKNLHFQEQILGKKVSSRKIGDKEVQIVGDDKDISCINKASDLENVMSLFDMYQDLVIEWYPDKVIATFKNNAGLGEPDLSVELTSAKVEEDIKAIRNILTKLSQ